jgi:type IV pilus assembly protein PilA
MRRSPDTPRLRAYSLVELMIVLALVGVLASLAIYSVRASVANAKTAEARSSLGQIGRDALTAFEGQTGPTRALCASATASVPSSAAFIRGAKYQPDPIPGKDWSRDAATSRGFACLKFQMNAPQYYMYSYASDGNLAASSVVVGTAFTATANGDLNGDGNLSTFSLVGAVVGGNLYVAPAIAESSPEE